MNLKMPRTYHLPWSPGRTKDDKVISTLDYLLDDSVSLVLSRKEDGENQRWHPKGINLRSLDSTGGKLRSQAKRYWAEIQHLIPENVSVFVEDMTWTHSIVYPEGSPNFYVIAVRNDITGTYASWDDTKKLAKNLGLPTVPELAIISKPRTIVDLQRLTTEYHEEGQEGLVFRVYDEILDWDCDVAKWVRANHVTTDQHWERQAYAAQNSK